MEIPRVGSKPWPTVHRISLTFSWRRTSAAVETEEATYQPRVVANVENNLGGGGEIPKKASTKKGRNHSPARTLGGRGRRRTVTLLRRVSRRRLAEYREEKGLLSSCRRAAPSIGLSEALDRRYLWRNCCASGREGDRRRIC